MNIPKYVSKAGAAATLAIGLWTMGMAQSEAANVVFYPNVDFSTAPYTIDFGGAATFTLTYSSSDFASPVSVSTGANAWVDSFAFGTAPSPYQSGILIGGDPLEAFSAFPTPTSILYSFSLDNIGLKFLAPDGYHYGYITTFGSDLVQYGYSDTPGAAIATGSAAPEPATWVMFIMGLGAVGALARVAKRRSRREVLA